jgi:hypothetical protein
MRGRILSSSDEQMLRNLHADLLDAISTIESHVDELDIATPGADTDELRSLVLMLGADQSIVESRLLNHDVALSESQRPFLEFMKSLEDLGG